MKKDESDFYEKSHTNKCTKCSKEYFKKRFQVFKLTPAYERQKERLRVGPRKKGIPACNAVKTEKEWRTLLQIEYIGNKKSCNVIGEECSCSGSAVRRALHRYSFRVRGTADVQRGVKKKGYHKTAESQLIRTSMAYKEWRLGVYKRDGFTCVGCGDKRGGNLQAHHIISFAINDDLRLEVSNGVTLCKKCHAKMHPNIKFVHIA